MIRWPFVSRARYTLLEHNFAEARAHWADSNTMSEDWRHEAARILRMYETLLDKYHELATAAHLGVRATWETGKGNAEPLAPAPPQSANPPNGTTKPRSVVAEAIRDEAEGDARLAAHLRKRASALRREGKTPEEIAQAVATWQSTEDEARS